MIWTIKGLSVKFLDWYSCLASTKVKELTNDILHSLYQSWRVLAASKKKLPVTIVKSWEPLIIVTNSSTTEAATFGLFLE